MAQRMVRSRKSLVGIFLVCMVLGGVLTQLPYGEIVGSDSKKAVPDMAMLGDVNTLQSKYDRWKAIMVKRGNDTTFVLGLNYNKGLSSEFTKAQGTFTLGLQTGQVTVKVAGLPETASHDVWMVNNGQNGISTQIDRMINLGSLERDNDLKTLTTSLDREQLIGFKLDTVVVTKEGVTPHERGLLYGMPSLFQRFFYNEEQRDMIHLASTENGASEEASIWSALVPTSAYARKRDDANYGLDGGNYALTKLVAKGADLFLNETFDGNGRTCGSCHSPLNNFTIDPEFIATLPKNDPLFVAEFFPGLEELEKPELMRKFGSILENVDGFDRPGVMRDTPHTLALMASLEPDADVAATGRKHAVGWDGGGSAFELGNALLDGSLRSFAIGAITQHFTRCLPRPQPFFDQGCARSPTGYELDAMEAFQLSLGRPADPDFTTLVLKGKVPTFGQKIYMCDGGPPGQNDCPDPDDPSIRITAGKCNLCHWNGGANMKIPAPPASFFPPGTGPFPTGNANFDNEVEDPPRLGDLYEPIPCDGGFGGDFNAALCDGEGGFGDGQFNTPPFIEAPDTGPYFHLGSSVVLQAAVAFYNGTAGTAGMREIGVVGFANGIGLNESEIEALAQFGQVLNALENIRSTLSLEKRIMYANSYKKKVKGLIEIAKADTKDAIKVLAHVTEHYDAQAKLIRADGYLKKALKMPSGRKIEKYVKQAMYYQRQARDLMCESGTILCEES